MAGCGCKGNKSATTQQAQAAPIQQTPNVLDEQRVAQVKSEIRNIVNKYYTNGKKK
jgi:anti-sigma28 factor (negative regulator of flagellin synthesis)